MTNQTRKYGLQLLLIGVGLLAIATTLQRQVNAKTSVSQRPMTSASLVADKSTVPSSAPATDNSDSNAAEIDWSHGDAQITNVNCGTMSFANMQDHHEYTLWVKGETSGTCLFKADGLTFHLPPNFGATLNGTTTLFSFQRFGPDVLVAWIPGY